MNGIKGIGLIICFLMVLMAYLKQVIPKSKTAGLMKTIISVFILVSILDGIKRFDINSIKRSLETIHSNEQEVWEQSSLKIADGLQNEFGSYIVSQGLEAEVYDVIVHVDQNSFSIQKVVIKGTDGEIARNLLAGRYRIGKNAIEVKDE